MAKLHITRADGDPTLRDWRSAHNAVIPTAPLSMGEVWERARRNLLDVAYLDTVLVGCTTVRPATDDEPVTVIARVLPAYRRRGFGSALYRHGLRLARDLGADSVQTVVLSSNPDGLRFAKTRGFVEVERYLLDGEAVPYIHLVLRPESAATGRASPGGRSTPPAAR